MNKTSSRKARNLSENVEVLGGRIGWRRVMRNKMTSKEGRGSPRKKKAGWSMKELRQKWSLLKELDGLMFIETVSGYEMKKIMHLV